MYRFAAFLVFVMLAFSPVCVWADDDLQWLRSHKGQTTDSVVADKRFRSFIGEAVPDFYADFGFADRGLKTGLKSAVMDVLSGPADTLMFPDEHSVVLSACRLNSCAEKGFVWIDMDQKQSIFAILHYVYEGGDSYGKPQLFLASRDFRCGAYPREVVERIKFWLHQSDLTPGTVRCLDGQKASETIL